MTLRFEIFADGFYSYIILQQMDPELLERKFKEDTAELQDLKSMDIVATELKLNDIIVLKSSPDQEDFSGPILDITASTSASEHFQKSTERTPQGKRVSLVSRP